MESRPPAPPSAAPTLSVADWDARIDALKQRVVAGDWSAALLRETADAQESREAAVEAEAEAARDAAHPFRVIGNTVRVPFGAGTRRAMICDVNGDGTLDVIFEASSGVPAAEATVPADTATRLERFETEDARAGEKDDEAKANRLKEEANALFKLKDSIAAGERYKLALATLKRAFADVSVGAGVLLSSGGRCRAGTVMGVDDGGAGAALDVMYDLEPRALLRELGGGDDADGDGGGDEDEEEEGVPRKRVNAVIAPTPSSLKLQLALYLNLARCAAALGRASSPQAVACCTLAGGLAGAALARGDGGADGARDARAKYVTAKVLRAKAHLEGARVRNAARDSAVASALDPQSREVKLLAQNVERAKRTALKANKKLAKEVTKWVATAVEGAGDAGSSTMSAIEGGANETDCPQS